MKTAYIKTPIGLAKINGSKEGITEISFLDETKKASKTIPQELEKAVLQLNEYFNGERTKFTLKLNPQGSEFQNEVWKNLFLYGNGEKKRQSKSH